MKNQFLILITTLLLFGCGEQKKERVTVDKETETVENTSEQIDSLQLSIDKNVNDYNIIERYFPEEIVTVEFDTIISSHNLQISIKSKSLDSYVTNEFEIEGKKYIDKYRDSEKHLLIRRSNEILLDTVLRKSDFSELTGDDFLKIADFHGYWFNRIENDTIEFFGAINKPETDWSIAFYHYFDLKTKSFKIEEHIDEEI
ncbi:MAG: hypothetical protein COS19_04720 [Flavobacteriaceae bacterium CG02_land_8_20_14_3_00_34_13]|nr:MAG: hypothetical protein COS19_04720 [Flavobacteriaceae bacterium CG02_land_8_20_14_3_00_34_13]